jgi:ring-1,2-phenylacetyl-CoA epoxidase subunit PaaE
MQIQAILNHFLEAFIENALIYSVFAFPFFLAFWVIGKKVFQGIRIQQSKRASAHHFKHDLMHSASTFVVFAVMDVLFVYLQSKGYTLLYVDPNQYGWAWLVASFALLLFINDTYFYWSHRAMHHPKLYKFFHRVHHESTDPSPLTAFAFHPSEAIVENALAFVLPFVMPLHFGVILAWQLFDMLNNVLGHLGYEVYPKGWVKIPVLKYKTASTHHNMHHQRFNGNYALYFTWWDKWMGTEFKDYEARHEQIFERENIRKS